MATGFGDFTHRMELLAKEMDGRALKARLTKVGVLSKADINEAVRNDLGDMSMSGWRRGNPTEIAGGFDVEGSTVTMLPSRSSAGHMRVLQDGRNRGDVGRMAGPGVSTDGTTARASSGGVRKVRARRGRRWNGTTRGKDTWTDATKIMERKMPDRYERALRADIARHIRGS